MQYDRFRYKCVIDATPFYDGHVFCIPIAIGNVTEKDD